MPDDLKTRTYTATIGQDMAKVTVRLGGAKFVVESGMEKNSFNGTVFGSTVTFDWGQGSFYYYSYNIYHVQEILPDGQILGIWGKLVAQAAQTISGNLVGGFNISGGNGARNRPCSATDNRVVFTGMECLRFPKLILSPGGCGSGLKSDPIRNSGLVMMMETVLQSEVAAVALRAEPMSAQDVLRLALERFAPSVALSSSFGAEDMVLVDMIANIDPKTRIFTLDTGAFAAGNLQSSSTRRASDTVQTIDVFFPQPDAVQSMVAEHGMNLFYHSVEQPQAVLRHPQDGAVSPRVGRSRGLDHGPPTRAIGDAYCGR